MKSLRFLSLFFVVLFLAVSCTTNEDEADGFEDELNSELEDVEDAESTTDVAEEAQTNEEEQDSTEQASEDNSDEDAEDPESMDADDEDFLAEDSESPATEVDQLEEKDLKGELEKENIATATAPPGATPVETPPPTAVDPLAQPDGMATAQVNPADVPNAAAVQNSQSQFASDGFEVINPPVPQEDLGVSDPLVAEVDPPLPSVKAAQEIVPLSKINKDPFFRNERLMNSVYLVRPNEDLAIISQKIYNEDKTSQLFADNPHLSKGIETGDKVYYMSPNRPEDKRTILTYFEDNKMAPQYYVTRKGDDIKKIGREVLGHEDGWKEIWATNDTLQTQAQLPSGLKIRYWSGTEPKAFDSPSTTLASSSTETTGAGIVNEKDPTPPQPETLPEIPPSPEPIAMTSEDPSMSNTSAQISPDQMPSMPASGNVPTVQAADDSVLTVAAIALIAMAALGIVAIQIKNRRSQSSSMPPSLEFTKV
jgi:hypothetical protein